MENREVTNDEELASAERQVDFQIGESSAGRVVDRAPKTVASIATDDRSVPPDRESLRGVSWIPVVKSVDVNEISFSHANAEVLPIIFVGVLNLAAAAKAVRAELRYLGQARLELLNVRVAGRPGAVEFWRARTRTELPLCEVARCALRQNHGPAAALGVCGG